MTKTRNNLQIIGILEDRGKRNGEEQVVGDIKAEKFSL